jgi:hypothetical protein
MAFWNRRQAEVSAEDQVRNTLAEIERLIPSKPKAALKLLDRLKGEAYPLVTFGGVHHGEFSRMTQGALGWIGPIPGVAAFSWKHWDGFPTVADILDLATNCNEPVLFLYEPPTRFSRGPVGEIEALRVLEENSQLLMVVIGEANTFLRRDLLLSVAPHLNPDSEEILQDLVDACKISDLQTLSL